MKWGIFRSFLCIICAIESLSGMEQPKKQSHKPRVNFLMDSEFHVTQYSSENMDYYMRPSQYIGKKFFGIIPLKESDKAKIGAAFNQVVQTNTTAKVIYKSTGHRYSAVISLLNKPSGTYDFFVKIKPVKK